MLDWEGNMVETKDRHRLVIADLPEDQALTSSLQISSLESTYIDKVFDAEIDVDQDMRETYGEVAAVLREVSPTLDDIGFANRLQARAEMSRFQMAIGATTVGTEEPLLLTEAEVVSEKAPDDDTVSSDEADRWLQETIDSMASEHGALLGELDLDAIMTSATHATPRNTADAEHLSKIWRIDLEAAERTLGVTTQSKTRVSNPKLARNFGTGDRMLRYKRIKEHFFMDTFFATSKAGKSTRGHSCCQLFVTDKGFVYVVPMKTKGEVLQAVKQFAKEVGAPEAIIADSAREQKSAELRKFCTDIGTTLRVL